MRFSPIHKFWLLHHSPGYISLVQVTQWSRLHNSIDYIHNSTGYYTTIQAARQSQSRLWHKSPGYIFEVQPTQQSRLFCLIPGNATFQASTTVQTIAQQSGNEQSRLLKFSTVQYSANLVHQSILHISPGICTTVQAIDHCPRFCITIQGIALQSINPSPWYWSKIQATELSSLFQYIYLFYFICIILVIMFLRVRLEKEWLGCRSTLQYCTINLSCRSRWRLKLQLIKPDNVINFKIIHFISVTSYYIK